MGREAYGLVRIYANTLDTLSHSVTLTAMTNWKTLFGSKSCEWDTPQEVFDALDQEFHFELDVCAKSGHGKTIAFDMNENGLMKRWAPRVCFMNPPYGPELKMWMRKAWEEACKGAVVVCLVPSRTDTAWWHDYAMLGEIRFIRGRLKFGGVTTSAPFPSAIVILKSKGEAQ